MPNVTPINEQYVLAYTIQSYFDKGVTAYQYAMIHNGGEIREKSGINKYNQEYDTGAYAKDVMRILVAIK